MVGSRNPDSKHRPAGLERAGSLLGNFPDLLVSKQKLRRCEGIEVVRMHRDQVSQTLCFTSRPFVLCGLPVRQLPKGELLYERRNGDFVPDHRAS